MKSIAALAARVLENIGRVIIGKSETAELLVVSLIAGGHVLLEDVPGTGKTVLAKSLARSLNCAFARIQFTPDLLPADITGTSVYNMQDGLFRFQPGPVFTNVLLADEINRATPRTQAALLECMEEKQVTESGATRALDAPFIVIATQNPIEIQGTFPLPEAQLDRFLMRLKPGYPSTRESVAMLDRFITDNPLETLAPVAEREALLEAQRTFAEAQVSEPVRRYIVELCEHTREHEQVQFGASPRAMLALLRASQALALVRDRAFVTPDDVKALAEPVLAHRIIVRGLYGQADAAKRIVSDALANTAVPTERPDA
ncbi:MAG: MoxR family ATPase [Clostridia bacterium]|nr:MoxR family ATPase [Clostridia bacterium]